MDLYRLSENCEYGNLHEEFIRNKIIVGIKDADLSKKLHLNLKLTLETAIADARQSEQAKKQQAVVRGSSTTTVEAVKSGHRPRHAPRSRLPGVTPRPQTCTRCGKSPPHGKPQCPAREATCHACHKKGHYKRCCRTKATIKQVVRDGRDSSEDEAFLGAIRVDGVTSSTHGQ